jgi:serine O-acetyltransferase
MSKNIFRLINSDLCAAQNRDPAARSRLEVIFTYSGFHAILGYRVSHLLWKLNLKFFSRFLSNLFRIITAIEIHPAAKIGEGFFIDHGVGLVIGETAELGDNVTMYQQVTLGGISPSLNAKKQKNVKRHPTIGNGAIIGSGAQILGAINIGDYSRIGSNAVVLKDVPKNQTFIGIPARKVRNKNDLNNFDAYGITKGKMDDPNKSSIIGILNEFHELNYKFSKLEKEVKILKKEKNTSNFIESKNDISSKEKGGKNET